MTKKISRRQFLRTAAASGAAVFLAACSQQDITITPLISGQSTTSASGGGAGLAATKPAVAPPPADTSTKGIQLMARGGRSIISQAAIDAWNKNSKAQVTLVAGSGGYGNTVDMASMIQTNIASGNQPWDGYATITSPWDIASWVKKDVIVPLDNMIEVSSTPGAGMVIPSLVPAIKDSLSYEGKMYGIPANVGSVAFLYYPQVLKDADYDRQLQTWDDVYTAAVQVKAQNPDINPFISTSSPLTDLWAWMWGAMANPIDPDGLIDIRSPEALDALDWLRRMADDGLTPNFQGAGGGGGGQFRHSTAMMTAQDSFGGFDIVQSDNEQPQLGKPIISYGLAPKQGSINAGVPFWVNLCVVLNQAKNPQGMVNFYLWLFGPDNKDVGKAIAQSAPKPCYTYTYTEFVQTNPDLAWQQLGIDLVSKSTGFPVNSSHTLENDITRTHIQNVLDSKKQYSRELATQEMQAAYDEIKAGIK
jgi:ABC-type glycerol-3-phosphate transport system substrate-binding protein